MSIAYASAMSKGYVEGGLPLWKRQVFYVSNGRMDYKWHNAEAMAAQRLGYAA